MSDRRREIMWLIFLIKFGRVYSVVGFFILELIKEINKLT